VNFFSWVQFFGQYDVVYTDLDNDILFVYCFEMCTW